MSCSTVLTCLLFALLQKNTHANNNQQIKVCGVPGPGAYMMYDTKDGSSSVKLLESYFNDNPMISSKSFAASQIGAKGVANNPKEAITGFNADTLSLVMAKADLPNYILKFYKSYATSLIHLRTGECDVAFGQYTHTAFRQYCRNVSTSGISNIPCKTLPVTTELRQKISNDDIPSYSCCATVGLPMFHTTLGLLIRTSNEAPTLSSFLFQPEVANIVALTTVAVLIAAHLIWIFERKYNPEQFPPGYLDGIDDAIWWSSTTVTTVGYGDKYPVTIGGRIIGLVWQFSGVIFLGLFAGTLSASMSRVASSNGISHISQLTRDHKVCTYYMYLESLRVYPFSSYTVEYNQCVRDLKAGKCDAIYYDELFLKHEFIIDDTMGKKYKVIPGDDVQFVGPYYPAEGSLTIQRKMNAALTILRKDGATFNKGVKTYYPKADGAGQNVSTKPTIDYGMCGVAIGFIIFYWGISIYQRWSEGEFNSYICCKCCHRIKKVEENDKDKNKDKAPSEDQIDTISAIKEQPFVKAPFSTGRSNFKLQHSNSFLIRDIELSKKKTSHAGHMHALYADGPEFVGLTNEVHSIRGGMDRLENMIAMLVSTTTSIEEKQKLDNPRLDGAISNEKSENFSLPPALPISEEEKLERVVEVEKVEDEEEEEFSQINNYLERKEKKSEENHPETIHVHVQ
jgi:hypothetical protein